MQVIEPEHNLMNDISCLPFWKTNELCQPFEKFTSFDSFRHHVVVVDVFDQVDDPDDIWMTFATQNGKFVLQKFDVNLLLLYLLLCHNFDSEFFSGGIVRAETHKSEGSLS